MVQYKAALVTTGMIKGTSRDTLYHEPGLESLADSRWPRGHYLFNNITQGLLPSHLQTWQRNVSNKVKNKIKVFENSSFHMK